MKLESSQARNQFILDHYELFENLAMIHARKVHDIFPTVPMCELIMSALEGIIITLGMVDLASSCWGLYVSRFALLNAISCAMLRVGNESLRKRTNHRGFRVTYIIRRRLICDTDTQMHGIYTDVDRLLCSIFEFETAKHLIKLLKNTIQYKIVQLILSNNTLRQIAIICHTTKRSIRKIIKSLPYILAADPGDAEGLRSLKPFIFYPRFCIQRKRMTAHLLFSHS